MGNPVIFKRNKMKKSIITLILVIVAMAGFAQSDSTKKEAPKIYTVKLEIKEGDEDMLYFALQSSHLMETAIPANRLQEFANKLAVWEKAIRAQLDKKKPAAEGGKK